MVKVHGGGGGASSTHGSGGGGSTARTEHSGGGGKSTSTEHGHGKAYGLAGKAAAKDSTDSFEHKGKGNAYGKRGREADDASKPKTASEAETADDETQSPLAKLLQALGINPSAETKERLSFPRRVYPRGGGDGNLQPGLAPKPKNLSEQSPNRFISITMNLG